MYKNNFNKNKKDENILSDKERILLSRIYKLDFQIGKYMKSHKDKSMNELLPKTDFIKKANELYNEASLEVINISLERTRFTQNLVNINKIKESK